jgi:hypothetical protein
MQATAFSRTTTAAFAYGLSLGYRVPEKSVRIAFRLRAQTRLTGFSLRAVANWSRGHAPSAPALKKLTELKRLFEALARLFDAKEIGPWLLQPNPAFDGSTPLQVIERGESDRLWRMIYELESGQPD